jgi:DNA ligase-1
MNLSQRIGIFTEIFDDLSNTTSLNEKRAIVAIIPSILREDFDFILECLNGVHKFGYTYERVDLKGDVRNENNTVKDVLEFLLEPMRKNDLSQANIARYISQTIKWDWFFGPIVNRTLKLGIGKSLLPKDGLSAMLAKKYEGKIRPNKSGYYITEKLDGNRCIARYDGTRWIFTSRNGKPMHVDFDMTGLPKEYVYDGEILAPQQVTMSEAIYDLIQNDSEIAKQWSNVFNSTSGLINQHNTNKNLVYNIFDVMIDDASYEDRRIMLNNIDIESNNVRILPVLARFKDATDLQMNADKILEKVVSVGGEGLMINIGDGNYMHKRTDQLLKYKKSYTMDMRVVTTQPGTGKYEGMVGALEVIAETSDGKIITCQVGSGLSDNDRLAWSLRPTDIIGQIVEVEYFSLSQPSDLLGSKFYSLRFPRLKRVRKDKIITSEY